MRKQGTSPTTSRRETVFRLSRNTGFPAPLDATLSAYVVQIDLTIFGFSTSETTDQVQIRLVNHLVTRSAGPTALGALNSVPEPLRRPGPRHRTCGRQVLSSA